MSEIDKKKMGGFQLSLHKVEMSFNVQSSENPFSAVNGKHDRQKFINVTLKIQVSSRPKS